MWSKILIFIISFLSIMLLLFGLKNIAFIFSPAPKVLNRRKDYKKSWILKYIINKWNTSKKILAVLIFLILNLSVYLLCRNFIFSLFASLCLEIFIIDLLKGFEERRKDLLNSQLVEFLNHMAVMLKAGGTVRSVFKSSVGWFKEPLNSYLLEVANELELNSTLDEALERFSQKCKSREALLLISSLKINNKIGGDLIPVLDNVADNIRHNLKLVSQIKTMSLQSRYSGNIISIFPIIILIMLCIFMSDAVMDFFSTGIGIISLIIGGVLEVAGIIIIKKITSIKEF